VTCNVRREAEIFFVFHREALKPVCARRGLDLSGLDVFLENTKTPLDLVTDTSWLGGKQLRLRGTAAGVDYR
jgi:hypothetical protein